MAYGRTKDKPALKYFYAVQATGRGHLSRYLEARGILEQAGHKVFAYATGPEAPAGLHCIDRFDPGPSFFIHDNRIAASASFRYNFRHLSGFSRSVRDITRILAHDDFHDVIIDFEPVSARAARRASIPFTIIDNQTFVLLDIEWPVHLKRLLRRMRTFVEYYYGGLAGARRILTYSLIPATAGINGQIIIPPCAPRESITHPITAGDHILFYSSIGGIPRGLIDFARNNPDQTIKAYVSKLPADPAPDNLILRQPDNESFFHELASCRVFVTNAGFGSIADAIRMGKPLVVAPIGGQWEQQINAWIVEHYGIGLRAGSFSVSTFEAAMRHDAPPPGHLREWLMRGRSMLRDVLTD
ncbi:MAG: hypothetical protein NTY46_12545 [Candidatus Sumerlaeota bacterium]|nr:hypothetical protein [Candidatus Sumerlaeota bacterium]